MRNITPILILVALVAMSGCTAIKADLTKFLGWVTANPGLVQAAVTTASTEAAQSLVTSKKVSTATATKITAALQPTLAAAQAIQTPSAITTTLIPMVDTQLAKAITNPTELQLTQAAMNFALTDVQNYLTSRQASTTQPTTASTSVTAAGIVVSEVIQGFITGLNAGIAAQAQAGAK